MVVCEEMVLNIQQASKVSNKGVSDMKYGGVKMSGVLDCLFRYFLARRTGGNVGVEGSRRTSCSSLKKNYWTKLMQRG